MLIQCSLLAFSPDGLTLASGSAVIRVWRIDNSELLREINSWAKSVAWSPDGQQLVSLSSDHKTLKFWNPLNGDQIGQLCTSHTRRSIDSVAIFSDGSFITTSSDDKIVQLWTQTTGEHAFESTTGAESVAISPDEELPVSGDDRGKIFVIHKAVRNAFIGGDLRFVEDILTQEINADDSNHNSYANRSVVRARNSEWDDALQDAVKSIAIQPSLSGYISEGIALCGKRHIWNAMEAFDLAFVFSNHDPSIIDLLLLIKSYLRVELEKIAFEHERYSEAAQRLNDSIPSTTDLFSSKTFDDPGLNIFTMLFGRDFGTLWQTANKIRCDALLRAEQVTEVVESYQYMMNTNGELAGDNCLEWSAAFKRNCTAYCVSKGDETVAARNYETAVEWYSAGIRMDSSCESLLVRRSKANLERKYHDEALHDADKIIELNPSSYLGYEVKHATLHDAQRYDEAIQAFNVMLSRLDDAPDPQIRKPRQQYVGPSEVNNTTRQVIQTLLENAPLRLLDTFTGHLCSRERQINTFMKSTEYKEILSSSMTRAHLQTEPIEEAVARYFRWVMLSHRWENKETLLHDIQDKAIYDLDPGSSLGMERHVLHRPEYHVELQRSVNSMFVWYRHSALTIIYLSDVPPSSKAGALANSTWNTRGWTIQEFLAPNVVLFYQADWTIYLDDRSPNHKESVGIMQELEEATDIDAEALVAFRPGMSVAREKLRWASTRVTTLQEDIAYSLFGIFGVHLPVIYGETKQNALGRLLQEIVAQSGDITALDWVGRSSEFNSCLPANITSYNPPPYTLPSLSEDQMQTSISFARCHSCEACFDTADGLQDMLITTEDKLVQFSRARSTRQPFLLVRPWNRYDLDSSDLSDEVQSANDDWLEPESPSNTLLSGCHGEDELVDLELQSRSLKLIVRLGQCFGALLLAQQRGEEFKRIASDHNIIAQVKDVTSIHDMMDIRTLEIL
ncbi:hypothetical protein EDD22DRAFT_948496 [Suillus occidentalis]|nr:hypothetical protein EDD22DRAFT_948496 [Suillus occidentalis]